MANKHVYLFAEGNKEWRDLLGGKGANLAEMTNIGLPVPFGFTITTETCNEYYANDKKFPAGFWDEIAVALKKVEEQAGKTPGRCSESLAGIRTIRGKILDAGHDGHRLESRIK